MFKSRMVVATIPVTDLDRAKQYYGETIGLELLWESPQSIRYSAGGGSELSIFKRAPSKADHTVAHFEVEDIEAAVKELEGRGVQFIDYTEGPLITTAHIAQLGPAKGAWFNDPDGNILGLRQG